MRVIIEDKVLIDRKKEERREVDMGILIISAFIEENGDLDKTMMRRDLVE